MVEKRGVTSFLSVILLILIVFVIGMFALIWGRGLLKGQIEAGDLNKQRLSCEFNVEIDVDEAECIDAGRIVVTVKNVKDGKISDFIGKIAGDTGSFTSLAGTSLTVGEIKQVIFVYDSNKINNPRTIEIIPIIQSENKQVYCESKKIEVAIDNKNCNIQPVQYSEERFGIAFYFTPLEPLEWKQTAAANTKELGVKLIRRDILLYPVGNSPATSFDDIDVVIQAANPNTVYLFTLFEGYPSSFPDNIEDYKAKIKTLVSRYKGNVKYWQIENEVYGAPNIFFSGSEEDYTNMVNIAYDAIKQEQPDAKVLLAGIALGASDNPPVISNSVWQILSFALQNAKYDAVDLHSYYKYELIPSRLDWLRQGMQQYGKDVPIFMTETGGFDNRVCGGTIDSFTLCYPEDVEYAKQSEEVVKRFTLAFANRVDKVFWEKIYDHLSPLYSEIWGYMALTYGSDYTRRPAYYTYKLMIEKLYGFKSIEKISEWQYKYIVNGKPVYVMWADAGKTVTLPFSNNKITHIVTVQGETLPAVETLSGSVQLTSTPIFVEEA